MKYALLIIFLLLLAVFKGFAQSNNDILNVLVANQTISQNEADSLRAEAAISQHSMLPDKKFKIDLELRPRFEYRNGYQQIPNDTTSAAVFVNQRSRISLSYLSEYKLEVRLSVQDLRVWGQQDPRSSTPSTFQVFEAWAEPYITQNFSIRIGRQRLMYDNQRLFAENDWRISGSTHDALNFRYNTNRISTDLALAFNQSAERVFGTDFNPSNFSYYKFLGVNYLRYQVSENLIFSAINAADGYQDKNDVEKIYFRFTDGGRIEFTENSFYLTFSGYYQWGKNGSGNEIGAWYLQPEARYTTPQKLTIRLGTEVFSGDNPNKTDNTDQSFVPLYGVAHRFNGSMDLITRFPGDIGNSGLVNPYLFMIKGIGKKIELRTDFHLFYSMEHHVQNDVSLKKYMGFENDWLFSFKPNAYTKLDAGYSWASVTETFEIIKKAGTGAHEHMPGWFYVMISLKPQLFSAKFK